MNKFLNYVPEKLIHINTRADGKKFASISLPLAESKTGYASFGVNMGQILDATHGKDRTVSIGYKSILLGDEAKVRKLSIATNKSGTAYKNIEMTNAAIADTFESARAAYRASREVAIATK